MHTYWIVMGQYNLILLAYKSKGHEIKHGVFA
jgi:hypothetical protein